MPEIIASMVGENVNVAPGTGSLALAGAITGFRSFSAAVGNGNTCKFIIRDATQFEVSVGTLTGGSTLSRDTVLENHLGTTAKVNFTGACTVELIFAGTRALVLDPAVTPATSAIVTQVGRDLVTAADAAAARAVLGTSSWKDPVVAAATGNVNIANPGTSTFDGYTATAGERILLPSQSAPAQNGIYIFNGSSSAMTRATDADVWAELHGAIVVVQRGSTLNDRIYLCTADPGGTLGTTALPWVRIDAGAALTSSITLGSLVTVSGTSVDVTSIPAAAKRITMSFSGVSTNGTSQMLLQLGDSGGVETTGYLGNGAAVVSGTPGVTTATAGFLVGRNTAAAQLTHGTVTLTLMDVTTNLWACAGVLADSASGLTLLVAGTKALSATLDRVRLTTIGGTDTFDAGSISVTWEI